MEDEKKNMGPEEPIVPEAPSPNIPGAPPAPSVTEQEVEQGTIPGMEEGPDPSTTVINLVSALSLIHIYTVKSPGRRNPQTSHPV